MTDFGPDGRGWGSREIEYDLGPAGPGKSIVVNITRAVLVRIMDAENYALYKAGEDCRAFQGTLTSSPYRFRVPREAHWHVVIDPDTYSGIAEFSVRLVDDSTLST